ncbi:nuclear transport factor 2 family protein [Oceanimonas sp. MB9]|uniref:nuclear transport factor 2 family protein n=1 Tax=Oceanimonas sp. MB9 TaxID=2588453 RepID=UPI0013F6205E|nr:nuclear transport factor 2 family protein [Oceanimonas sp. MB9]NHI00243.1 hypothetical protein [Oceanimonas sp. MB9]
MTEKGLSAVPDYQKIIDVINLYVEGWKGDVDKFKAAFDEDAWIFFIDASGKRHKYLLTDCFESWSRTGWDIDAQIVSINQVGSAANVIMNFNNLTDPAASFVDFHNMLEVNGRWLITNKTAVHID